MKPLPCPTCHRPIPPNAPGGFCPACVLRDADEPPPSGRPAPSLAEVATAFPQFEILSLIGQGGMGSVFKVRQPGLDRVVALKILCPEPGRDPAFAERFAREARVLAKLNHPNIVTVFEHGETGGFFYLLMEYVDGVNLRQAMRAGRFTPEQALAVVPGICDALQAAHAQGIWHRDIKPENILLDAQGAVKIVDFGIARLVGDPARDFTLTRTGAALGSAPYMAPEQHEKPHEVDHRADIYSLGVVIYEMLTGELPLGRFPAPSQRAAVSTRIDEIVFQTLEKERELRQQSANEVKTDVHRAMRPEVAATGPRPTPATPGNGLGKLAFAMFLVATVIAPVLWLYYARNEVVFMGILSLLSALGLALMSWREPLGKFVTIATGMLLVTAAAVLALRVMAQRDQAAWAQQQAAQSARNLQPTAAGKPPGPIAPPQPVEPQKQPRPRVVPSGSTEVPKHAGLTTEQVIRALNKLANESNGKEFGDLMRSRNMLTEIETMPALLGEIICLRNDSRFSVRGQDARFIAEMKRHDGGVEYQGLALVGIPAFSGNQLLTAYYLCEIYTVPYRATCRIEFLPESGSAMTILRTQMGNEDFMAAASSPGQYDLCGDSTASPEDAVEAANAITANLHSSLKKFGLDATFKIIKPAEAPTSRWPGEDIPAAAKPNPASDSPPKPVATAPQNPKPTTPPKPPALSAEEVFRKMVAAANAADGEEFVKHEYRSSFGISFGSPPPVASGMAPFFGEILLLKPLPPQKNDSKDTSRLIAQIKAKDGTSTYREFQFTIQDGQRKFLTEGMPRYRASCRVEFRPEQGKAESILKLHLGEKPFTAVPGADGQFDIGGEEFSADAAVRTADRTADQLLESLKRAGLDSFFKIIQRAKPPARPWLGEDPSPVEKPTP